MNKNRETRYIPAKELRIATGDDGSRHAVGYAALFNSLSVDMGGWRETIAPGAFTRALNSSSDVVCLRDHDNSILLGRTRSKTLSLDQDTTGLKFDCALPNTSQANDLVTLMERGDIDGCSFGFICRKDDWNTDVAGVTTRTLIDVDLFDVSIVSEPAYPDTSVALRSAPAEIRSALKKRDMDVDPTEEDSIDDDDSEDIDTDCDCLCDPCVDGKCEQCTDPSCEEINCRCSTSEEAHRNRAHMLLELAKLNS